MRNVCLCKHHLTPFIKPQGGLVTHLLPHPQDVHLILIWRPRINQGDITKPLVIFEHFEMEYKCLFKGTSWLVWVDLGVFLFWKQLVSWDLRMNLHMWVGRCESAREATCYLFVCLLMENKPGEMKCFAWKIDFSLPGNKLSVPHWPFDLLCLFEFAEVSSFILDTFRHGSTHYLEIFLSYSIPSAVLTNIYRVNVVPQLQRCGWSASKKTNIYQYHITCLPPDSTALCTQPVSLPTLFHGTSLFFPHHIYWGNSWQSPQGRPPSSTEDLTGD